MEVYSEPRRLLRYLVGRFHNDRSTLHPSEERPTRMTISGTPAYPPIVVPPITGSTIPVIYEESASDAKNT